MPRYPGFIGGSYPSQSLTQDCERAVNLYVERAESRGAKAETALYPSPGFQQWAAVADVGARASIVAEGRLFSIYGLELYEFSSAGVATRRGNVAHDGNPAQLIYNGILGGQLGIAAGGHIYSYDLATDTLSASLLGPGYTHLAFADSQGLAFNPTTGKVNLSDLNDLGTWNAGTFFRRGKFPDPWQAMFVDPNSLIWLIGTETFEVWYNANPASTQPWAPLSGLFGRLGIAAPFAFSVTAQGSFWLSRNKEGGVAVAKTRGSGPVSTSTYAVNTALAGYRRTSTIETAEMLAYHDQGHTFVNLSLPGPGVTWTYDVEGNDWAERGQFNPDTGRYGLWAPRVHVDAFGKHLVGDRTTGVVWEMDTALATEVDGTGIVRMRVAPGLTDEHKRHPIDQFELLMDVGVGTVTGAGVDPKVMMRVSQDGGRTFGNQRQASIGRMGDFRRRVYFTRLGAPPDCAIECTWSAPVPIRVVDAFLNNQEKAA